MLAIVLSSCMATLLSVARGRDEAVWREQSAGEARPVNTQKCKQQTGLYHTPRQ